MFSVNFWLGLASVLVGSLIMHRYEFRWWIVLPLFLALCFIAVLLKG